MDIYWPTPGFKGRIFKLCVLTRKDFNFCIRSSPLQGCHKPDLCKNTEHNATLKSHHHHHQKHCPVLTDQARGRPQKDWSQRWSSSPPVSSPPPAGPEMSGHGRTAPGPTAAPGSSAAAGCRSCGSHWSALSGAQTGWRCPALLLMCCRVPPPAVNNMKKKICCWQYGNHQLLTVRKLPALNSTKTNSCQGCKNHQLSIVQKPPVSKQNASCQL